MALGLLVKALGDLNLMLMFLPSCRVGLVSNTSCNIASSMRLGNVVVVGDATLSLRESSSGVLLLLPLWSDTTFNSKVVSSPIHNKNKELIGRVDPDSGLTYPLCPYSASSQP